MDRFVLRLPLIAAALAMSPVVAPAQEEFAGIQHVPAQGIAATSAVLTELDGVLWGFGDRYKTEFRAQDVIFTPALGAAVSHNMTVALALRTVGRGDVEARVSPAIRSFAGNRVTYSRAEVSERYDVRQRGLEQSFAFDTLPPGSGDLVIRASFATEFEVSSWGDGLALELAEVGRLYVSGVTAVDASGQQVAGTITYADGAIELRVPAAFVDTAQLPLVVDPLIGAAFDAFTSSTATNIDRNPDVAYDATNDVYLVVYERVNSGGDYDINAQRVTASGALVGSRIYIQTSSSVVSQHCRVANVATTDSFVVVWKNVNQNEIKARIIDAATGVLNGGGELAIAAGGIYLGPDVGGETSSEDDAIVVYTDTANRAVRAAQIQTNAQNVIDNTVLYQSVFEEPGVAKISNGNGSTGNHMVVFTVEAGLNDRDVHGVIIDRNIGILDSDVNLTAGSTNTLLDQKDVAVDGDGRHWVAAWAEEEGPGTMSYDVYCRSITLDESNGAGSMGGSFSAISDVTVQTAANEYAPSVIWTGGQTLIGWSDVDGTGTNTYLLAYDPFACTLCETTLQVGLSIGPGDDDHMNGCSEVSAGANGSDTALLVWEFVSSSAGTDDDIMARRWDSVDGSVTDLGGGCGNDAGQGYATCARSGNATFSMRLLSDLPNTPAILVISRHLGDVPCGSCTLRPDPYAGWIAPRTTDSNSRASFDIAIPSSAALTGVTFYAQWLVSEPVSPGCYLFSSDLTNAFSLRIQ